MDNERHDDLARSITGGTLFSVIAIFAFLIIYTMAGSNRDAAPLHHVKTGSIQTAGGQHE